MSEHIEQPLAGLSLDLDNLWSYLRSYGDPRWAEYPSYLDVVVPRIIETLDALELRATFFVVGRDAEAEEHAALIDALHRHGHELASHSYDHHPGFADFTAAQLEHDCARSEAALARFTGGGPLGFRAPAFALSATAVEVLRQRGYRYDSSLFPCSIGALARLWQKFSFARNADDEARQSTAYGGFGAARQPLQAFQWDLRDGQLLELPVTTMPCARLPVHWTYLNFIAGTSSTLAMYYLRCHLWLLQRFALSPVLLLHPTDFLGADDDVAPAFMPGMRMPWRTKLGFLQQTLESYRMSFELLPLQECIERQTAGFARGPATTILAR